MTSKQWLRENPQVTKQQLLDELVEWRDRTRTLQKQLKSIQLHLAEIKYEESKKLVVN